MDWLEVTVMTHSAGLELVAQHLTALGYDSFQIDDEQQFTEFLEENRQYWDYVDEALAQRMQGTSRITLYLVQSPDAAENVAALREQLALLRSRHPNADLGPLDVTLRELPDEDWENNWKQNYQPIPIGSTLAVVPQWMKEDCPAGRIPILLNPGMIFGTGSHATTRMCMQALEQADCRGKQVIDLGSGSGILSITALLLGARSAVGVDIDPKAEDIARENAAMNGLDGDRFRAVTGDVIGDTRLMRSLAADGYELVLANIVADVLISLAPVVPHFLREDGRFLCSGILDARLTEVLNALKENGLEILSVQAEEDWRCVTARREV